MAKISELVKTYKFLNDPNAPAWNVRFLGGFVLALGLIAAAGALIWSASTAGEPESAPAAATQADAQPGDLASCEPTEVAEEMARLGTTSLPKGHKLPSGCEIR